MCAAHVDRRLERHCFYNEKGEVTDRVLYYEDMTTGLRSCTAVPNLPDRINGFQIKTIGGVKVEQQSLGDALEHIVMLERIMNSKTRGAGLSKRYGIYGNKTIILADPEKVTKEMDQELGRFLFREFGNSFISSVDMNRTMASVHTMAEVNPAVCTEDPSIHTAKALVCVIDRYAKVVFPGQSPSMAVIGLGNVGSLVAPLLKERGYTVWGSDEKPKRSAEVCARVGIPEIDPYDAWFDTSIVIPCCKPEVLTLSLAGEMVTRTHGFRKAVLGSTNGVIKQSDERRVYPLLNTNGIFAPKDEILSAGGILGLAWAMKLFQDLQYEFELMADRVMYCYDQWNKGVSPAVSGEIIVQNDGEVPA